MEKNIGACMLRRVLCNAGSFLKDRTLLQFNSSNKQRKKIREIFAKLLFSRTREYSRIIRKGERKIRDWSKVWNYLSLFFFLFFLAARVTRTRLAVLWKIISHFEIVSHLVDGRGRLCRRFTMSAYHRTVIQHTVDFYANVNRVLG